MPMSKDDWLAKTLSDRPPLSQPQIAALRPVFAPVFARMAAAPAADMAGAATEQEPLTTPKGTAT